MTTSNQNDPMPPALRDVFDGLATELNWICAKFKIYKQLFATDKDRRNLIYTKAQHFFVLVENSLADDIVVSICRITDGLKSCGHECLVLERLAENLDGSTPDEATFKQSVRQESQKIYAYCVDLRDWRNRRIAHANLATSLNRPLAPLPNLTLDMIKGALHQISKLMNKVESHFIDTETRYEEIILRGDGEDLVFFLGEADKYEQLKRKSSE